MIGRPFVGALVSGLPRVALIGLGPYDALVWLAVPTAGLAMGALVSHALGPRAARGRRGPGRRVRRRPTPEADCNTRRWRWRAFSAASAARISPSALTQTWDEGMTSGRGFIAIALVIFAQWNPLWLIAGALVFGGAEAVQLQLQARGADVSPFLMTMVPYLLTLTDPGVLGLEPALGRAGGARPKLLRRGIGHDTIKRRPS